MLIGLLMALQPLRIKESLEEVVKSFTLLKLSSKRRIQVILGDPFLIWEWKFNMKCCEKSHNFTYIFCCGNFVERHSSRIVSGDSPETMQELCLSTKFPHQKIRWVYGIFRSEIFNIQLYEKRDDFPLSIIRMNE